MKVNLKKRIDKRKEREAKGMIKKTKLKYIKERNNKRGIREKNGKDKNEQRLAKKTDWQLKPEVIKEKRKI